MNLTTKIVSAIAATLVAVTLAGCTPADRGLFNEKPVAVTKTATPSPTQTVAAPKPGDILTEAQAIALRKSLPKNGDWVYTTAAEVNIFINSQTPLPEVVKADISAQMLASVNAAKAPGGDAMGGGVSKTQKMLQTLAGKPIVLVFRIWTFLEPAYESRGWIWTAPVATSPGDIRQIASKAEAVRIAQTFINSQTDPAAWEIVVAE